MDTGYGFTAPTVTLGPQYGGGGGGGGSGMPPWLETLAVLGGLATGGLNAYQQNQSLNQQRALTQAELNERKREFDVQNAYRANPQYAAFLSSLAHRFGVDYAPSSSPATPHPTTTPPPTPGAAGGGGPVTHGTDGTPYTLPAGAKPVDPTKPWNHGDAALTPGATWLRKRLG